jgi:prevent-host-death family protein
MPTQHKKATNSTKRKSGASLLGTWKLEDAKARFSEIVRRAGTNGPQVVTVRGKRAAVVLSADEFERLRPAKKKQPLIDFLQGLGLSEIPLIRESDTGRDPDL